MEGAGLAKIVVYSWTAIRQRKRYAAMPSLKATRKDTKKEGEDRILAHTYKRLRRKMYDTRISRVAWLLKDFFVYL